MASVSRLSSIVGLVWLSTIAASNASNCLVEKVAELPLFYHNGLVAVVARIGDSSVAMGVDTGSQTLVTPETAVHFRLTRDPHRRTRAFGTTGTTIVDNVLLRSFEFAGKHYATRTVPKISLAASNLSPNPLGGLIGSDVLSEYDVDLDLAGRSMILYKVRGCSSVTPPWTEPYTSLAVKITAAHNIVMPVDLDDRKLSALLDTGATHFSISKRGALKSGVTEATLKADPMHEVSGIGGTKVKQPLHRFRTLIIGGETFRDTPLQLMRASVFDGDVLIGQTYLMPRRVWISYSTRTLFIRAPKTIAALQFPSVTELPPAMVSTASPPPVPPSISSLYNPCLRLAPGNCGLVPAPDFPPGFPDTARSASAKFETPSAPPSNASLSALPHQLPKETCDLRAGTGERKTGRVIGFLSRGEALAMIQLTQRRTHGTISPDYLTQQRVRVQPIPIGDRRPTVLVPNNMRVQIGDTVEYINGHPASGLPCHYIPNLISRVLASER
ncbi:MAG: aspartyl protease family protein [Rhodomicrobium sp.]